MTLGTAPPCSNTSSLKRIPLGDNRPPLDVLWLSLAKELDVTPALATP